MKEFFTNKQLALAGDAMLSVGVLAGVSPDSFEGQITEKTMSGWLATWNKGLWKQGTIVPVRVNVNSAKYGKLTIEFQCRVKKYTSNKSVVKQWGDISYKIVGGSGMKKVEAKMQSGTAGKMAKPDVDAFAEIACSLAKAEIEKNYKKSWAGNAQKVAGALFKNTITDMLQAADQGTFSGMAFQFLQTPSAS